MIHTFSYIYKGVDHNFVWDVEGGSLHLVDYEALLCLKDRFNLSMSAKEAADFSSLDSKLKDEIQKELTQLESEGLINTPIKEYNVNSHMGIKALCLNICHDCNMACGYCFAGGGSYSMQKDYMSFEVAKLAVDFLIDNSGKRQNLEIDFFGGEPLLNLDVVKKTVEYAKDAGAKQGKEFFFTMTTNGLLLNDETSEYLNKEMGNIILSIDGRPQSHNGMRRAKNGDKEAYQKIIDASLKLKEKRGADEYYVRGTYTSKNLDFVEDIKYLHDLGFENVSMEPVILEPNNPLAIKDEHIPILEAGYEQLADYYLNKIENGQKFRFFHFMIDLKNAPCVNKRLNGCGAGFEYLAVSPEGNIYPCHQFVGNDKYKVGNVYEGIKRTEIADTFRNATIYTKPHCTNCMAKYYCGGGCLANGVKFFNDLNGEHKISCKLQRKRLELSLALETLKKMYSFD